MGENYLFLNVMVNFVIVNQKLTGSALQTEKKSEYEHCELIYKYKLYARVYIIFPYSTYSTLGPVVQSIVSLTISLRHKFVKQISAKVTNTLLFLSKKYENPLHLILIFFSTKITVYL